MNIKRIFYPWLTQKYLIIFLIAIDFLTHTASINAQLVDTLKNPNWQEISDTGIPNSPEFGNNVYIDFSGLQIKKDIVIFDMVSSDGNYARIQVNCVTNSWRELRRGWFNSQTEVQYYETGNDAALNSYRQKIFNAVCR
jgi:hypothetical protein